MSSLRRARGTLGEALAAQMLEKKGLTVLCRNYYTRYGEIDIVASWGDTLVFAEVKTRSSVSFGTPAEAVTKKKLAHMALAAEVYLDKLGRADAAYRLDVIEVLLGDTPRIRHHINVTI